MDGGPQKLLKLLTLLKSTAKILPITVATASVPDQAESVPQWTPLKTLFKTCLTRAGLSRSRGWIPRFPTQFKTFFSFTVICLR